MTTRPLPALVPLLLVAAGCTGEAARSFPEAPAEPLFSEIEYRFVGDRGEVDADGWALQWEATVRGDVTGEGRWYFREPNPIEDLATEGANWVYYEARWEIRVDGETALAGRSVGKTVTRPGEDGVWDGHGVVTRSSPAYTTYLGRHVYETGPVVFGDDPPRTAWGRGLFAIH